MSSFRDFVARQEAAATDEDRQLLEDARRRFGYAAEIAQLRLARGLSQRQLSALSGIAQSEISKIESAVGNPTAKTLETLLAAMGARLSVQALGDQDPAASASP